MTKRSLLPFACFAAAAAWPSLVTAVETALASPLQRALNASICGSSLHAAPALLGHCAACWVGSAFLVALGAYVFATTPSAPALARR